MMGSEELRDQMLLQDRIGRSYSVPVIMDTGDFRERFYKDIRNSCSQFRILQKNIRAGIDLRNHRTVLIWAFQLANIFILFT